MPYKQIIIFDLWYQIVATHYHKFLKFINKLDDIPVIWKGYFYNPVK